MTVVPPGYCNLQLFGVNPAGRNFLTACAFSIEAWDPAELDDLDTNLNATDYVSSLLANDYDFTGGRVVVGTVNPSAPLVFEATFTVGGNSGAGASPNSAFLLNKVTALGGRKGKGRSFLPGPTESTVADSGNLTGDVVTNPDWLTTFWPTLGTSIGLGDPYLLHEDPEDEPSAIITFTLSGRIATQRRRLRG